MEEAPTITSLQTIEADAASVEAKVANLAIINRATFELAAESVSLLKAMFKLGEEKRKTEKQPHIDAGSAVDAKYKPILTRIKNLIESLDGQMGEYHAAQKALQEAQEREAARQREAAEKKAREERAEYQADLRKAAEESAKTGKQISLPTPPAPVAAPVAPAPAPAAPKTVETAFGNVSMRGTWTFEITDATLIPREYLCPDETKIGKVVKAGVRTIPGVHIWEKFGSTTKGG